MKISNIRPHVIAACLAFSMTVSTAHAEVYKWVDENGRVHYSERKPEASKANPVDLKIAPPPTYAQTPQVSRTVAPSWQDRERELRQRQAEEQIERAQSRASVSPRSLSGGLPGNTDASRCNFARDILNGSLHHRNGAPIDKNDIDTARSDVRLFCR